jgi:hypothetical protein
MGFKSIVSAIKTLNCDNEDIYVILFAGICNLTTQIKSYCNTLHYNNKTINGERKKDDITEEIDDLYLALCTRGITLKIATIPPANLSKYEYFQINEKHPDRTSPYVYEELKKKYTNEQISLENDLEEINSFITDFNTKNGTRTPRLHNDLVKRSKKKTQK